MDYLADSILELCFAASGRILVDSSEHDSHEMTKTGSPNKSETDRAVENLEDSALNYVI